VTFNTGAGGDGGPTSGTAAAEKGVEADTFTVK
jgi:hypothetical protein